MQQTAHSRTLLHRGCLCRKRLPIQRFVRSKKKDMVVSPQAMGTGLKDMRLESPESRQKDIEDMYRIDEKGIAYEEDFDTE